MRIPDKDSIAISLHVAILNCNVTFCPTLSENALPHGNLSHDKPVSQSGTERGVNTN
jgi:hypothetical protein